MDRHGRLRDPWRSVLRVTGPLTVDRLGSLARAAERFAAAERARQLLHDDLAAADAWSLDPVPWVLDPAGAADLEAGLTQRLRLARAVLGDLCGPRRILTSGTVPVEAVASHPAFAQLRPGHPPTVTVLAADVVRAADGSFVVVGTDTSGAAGDGHALPARRVTTRLFPAAARLGIGGPEALIRELVTLAGEPGARGTVVLTGDPESPGNLEHAAMAALAGLPAVEGTDLFVDEQAVWLRTLDGPRRVRTVLRRVHATRLDPLEDDGEGGGSPGLAEAARSGKVRLVNGPGAEVADAPALWPFLAEVCALLLGEDLILGPPGCRWRWEPGSADGTGLTVVTVDPGGRVVVGPSGSEVADGAATVTVDPVPLATTPVWDTGLRPGAVLARFTVADPGNGPRMWPGADTVVLAGNRWPSPPTGRHKDTWIPIRRAAPTPTVHARADTPAQPVPTRIAETALWLGRYAERAETTARLARLALEWWADDMGDDEVAAAVGALGRITGRPPAGGLDVGAEILSQVTVGMGSTVELCARVAANARRIPGYLSRSTWRVLTLLDAERRRLAGLGASETAPGDLTDALDGVEVPLAAFAGLAAESLVRGTAWRMLDVGRRLERAVGVASVTASLAGVADGAADPDGYLELALAAAESLVAHRRRFRAEPTPATVAAMILEDPANPRSVRFQADRLAEHIRAVAPAGPPALTTALGALGAVDGPAPRDPGELAARCEQVVTTALALAEAVNSAWFSGLGPWRRP